MKGPYSICYAISTSDDPLGSYYRYEFLRPLFPDYPRPAVWPDGYYVPTSTGDDVIEKHACVVERNAVPPPVVVRAMTADDRAWRTTGVVQLPALTRTIRIDYAALSLTIPERVRFRYRLEGWETSWHDAATRRRRFASCARCNTRLPCFRVSTP